MSRGYKTVKNSRETNLMLGQGKYVSIGVGGTDITIRGNGKVMVFDDWIELMDANNEDKAVYCKRDLYGGRCAITGK